MYTSVTLIQQRTGQTLTADQQSFVNTVIIPALTDWLNRYLGTSYLTVAGPTTVIKNGDGTSVMLVPELSTVTAIEPRNQDGTLGDALDADDYYYSNGALYLYSGRWATGRQNWRISGNGIVVPYPLQLAATIMASNMLNAGSTTEGGLKSEKIGEYTKVYGDGGNSSVGSFANDEVESLLAIYKPVRLA